MKSFLLPLLLLVAAPLLGQCPEGDVNLYYQHEVEAFLLQYPDCTELPGDLYIGAQVTDLSGLSGLTRIEGSLWIDYSDLTDLNNFDQLEHVGGDLLIEHNGLLKDLGGFPELVEIGGTLRFQENAIVEITGFGKLIRLGGDLVANSNYYLEKIDGFPVLESLQGNIGIGSNDRLTSVEGFPNLVSVGLQFMIGGRVLRRIEGFPSLQSVDSNFLIEAPAGDLLQGFDVLQRVGGTFLIGGSFTEIPNFNTLTHLGGGLELTKLEVPDISGFNNLQTINGWLLLVQNPGIRSITGFHSLTDITGVVQILVNEGLESLRGLGKLERIGGLLQINENDALLSLEGLESLVKVADSSFLNDISFSITNNDKLTDCSAVCELLVSGGITGIEDIRNNPSPCSTEEEISAECHNFINLCESSAPVDLFGLLSDGEPSGGSWSPALASGTGSFDPSLDPAGTYIYSFGNGAQAEVEVIVDESPEAGTDTEVELCSDVAAFELLSLLEDYPQPEGQWTYNGNPTLSTFNPGGTAPGTYIFKYTVDGGACGSDSAELTLDLKEAPWAGTDSVIGFCSSNMPTDLFYSLGSGPQRGGSWNPLPVSGTGVFDPQIDAAGEYVYTVTTSCGTHSATVTVEVTPDANAGEDTEVQLCPSDGPVSMLSLLGGNPLTNGYWEFEDTAVDGVFDPSQDRPGRYVYTVDQGVCNILSAELTISFPNTSTSASDLRLSLCTEAAATELFGLLGPEAVPGGEWTPPLQSGSGLFDPATDASGTYSYFVAVGSCGSYSGEVLVEISETPDAGEDAKLVLCASAAAVDLWDFLGGTPDSGGQWNGQLPSPQGYFDPATVAAGIYTYSVGSSACGTATAQITVEVYPAPNTGESKTLDLCKNAAPVDLFALLDAETQRGGTWSPALPGGIFDPALNSPDTYTYTVGTAQCGTASATVTIRLLDFTPVEDFSINTKEMGKENTVEISTPSGRTFEVSLDGVHYQTAKRFNKVPAGEHTVYLKEVGGCGYAEKQVWLMGYPAFLTPNNDGFNDTWGLEGTNGRLYNINIFDRYGKLLSTLRTGQRWDGTSSGRSLPSDDYWFRAYFEDGMEKTGHFSLLSK